MKKELITPTNIITITTTNVLHINLVVTTNTNKILHLEKLPKLHSQNYMIRKNLKTLLDRLISDYDVDTLVIEQNQLFINKIDRYPDSLVLQNILLAYGIKIMIEDNYYDKIKYILEIPRWEWKETILHKKVEYAIDLYKSHVLIRSDLDEETLKIIDYDNYYETLCFSEICLYDKFLKEKYQINSKN